LDVYVNDLLINLIASAIFALCGFVVGAVAERIRQARNLKIVAQLKGRDERTQILLPNVTFQSYISHINSMKVLLPGNNPFMPLQEAIAAARLMEAFKARRHKNALAVRTADHFGEDFSLTICLGGWGVNTATAFLRAPSYPS
jgi:hypothetical protein